MRSNHLCQLASDFRGDMPSDGMLFQEKRDGWRALLLRDWKGRPGLFTRNGMQIEGVGHILYRLAEIERAAGEPVVFDGEFQVDGTLAATKAWCERGWKAGEEDGQLFLFDALPLSAWEQGGDDMPLVDRLKRLRGWLDAAEADEWTWRPGSRGRDEALPPVVMLEDGWAFDEADVLAEARRVWAAGGEGLMLKHALEPYRRNRNAAWQKAKRENMHKWMRRAA